MRTHAVGVALPVHDEAELLPAALMALERALRQLPDSVAAHVVVVLDHCTDHSAVIARRWQEQLGAGLVTVVQIEAGNVGIARATGCNVLLQHHRVARQHLWLATTDADSQVPPSWLSRQVSDHEDGIDLWTGTVEVDDWADRTPSLAARWTHDYRAELRPIHGASFGINAETYELAGGFPARPTGEDRALHATARALGVPTHHDRRVPVTTSARRVARAPHGFAGALNALEVAPTGAAARPADG